MFLVSLDATMLYAVFDSLRAGFRDATAADLSWVLNAYTVVYAALLIPAGGLADTHGRKKVFLFGVALFLLASAGCGLAPNIGFLIAARVLQAIGAALLTPASLSMVLAAFPHERRAVVVASWGAVGAVAAAIGPSLGSLMADRFGWPWAFYVNLPLGAFSLWRGAVLLREARIPDAHRRVDLVGMALMIGGIGAITLSIVEAESPRWTALDHALVAASGRRVRRAVHRMGAGRESAADRPRAVQPPDLSLRQPRDAVATACAFAMMFFTFFFYMRGDLALQPAARGHRDRARTVAGRADRGDLGTHRRALRPSTSAGRRRARVRVERPLVPARAGHSNPPISRSGCRACCWPASGPA